MAKVNPGEFFNQVKTDFVQKHLAELRKLYVEVTGQKAVAEALSPMALQNEIVAKSPEGEVKEVFRRTLPKVDDFCRRMNPGTCHFQDHVCVPCVKVGTV